MHCGVAHRHWFMVFMVIVLAVCISLHFAASH